MAKTDKDTGAPVDPTNKPGAGNPNIPKGAVLADAPITGPNQQQPQLGEPVDQRSPGQADPNVPPFDKRKPHVDPASGDIVPPTDKAKNPPAPGMVLVRARETVLVRAMAKYSGEEFWVTEDEARPLVEQKRVERV